MEMTEEQQHLFENLILETYKMLPNIKPLFAKRGIKVLEDNREIHAPKTLGGTYFEWASANGKEDSVGSFWEFLEQLPPSTGIPSMDAGTF